MIMKYLKIIKEHFQQKIVVHSTNDNEQKTIDQRSVRTIGPRDMFYKNTM